VKVRMGEGRSHTVRLFSGDITRVDDPYLAHALTLAERARGATAPNPLVGCVVVRDGRIVGEGYHPRAGEAHAEVFALADAGPKARGADVYVTLEPCRHHGRTPPCTDALIAAGVARVVIGMKDPTALAAGGAEVLRNAGIAVEFADDADPYAELNEGWLKRNALGVPLVVAKVGLSLDARPALVRGERASMTGESGARVTRRLRSRADAVLVGAATVIADDPALTLRDGEGHLAERQPLRVVLARTQLPAADARVFDTAAPTLVLADDHVDDAALRALPEHVLVERYERGAGLAAAMRALGARGLSEVLVEPGPRLLGALWSERLVDHLVLVTAGGMAGADAPSLFGGEADAVDGGLVRPMRASEAGIVGDVSVTVWRPVEGDES